MRQMFVNKVKETEGELKEKEREVSPDALSFILLIKNINHQTPSSHL